MSIFVFCCFSCFLNAQSLIEGTFYESSEVFETLDANISQYQIYKIDINKADINITSKNPFLNIQLGSQVHELNLYTGSLTVSYEMDSKPLLLGGSTRKGGTVSMTINDDFIFGFIQEGSSKVYIEPLRHLEKNAANDLFVVYNVAHVIETGEHVCGSDQVEGYKIEDEDLQRMPTTMCKIVDYAIANTRDMVTELGSVTAVMDFNLAVLNDVQTNYRSEFDANLEYDVVANFIPSSSANDPLTPNTSTTNASTLLSNFRNWARGPGNAGGGNSGGATGEFGVDYTMAGLWTDRDITFNGNSGTVGLAYTPGWHHLLERYTAPGPSLRTMVTHEIGHNWSCVHDSGSPNIMWPSVLLVNNWNAAGVTSTNNRVASQGYLNNCSTIGAPNANFFQSSVAVCNGETIDFEDQSQYGATRVWDFPTGTPSTSTDEKPSITYNTNGLHYAKVTSTNGAGSDDFINYVHILPSPPIICTPSGGGGATGINNVVLSNISNGSSASGIYDDFSCSDFASLDANTSYSFFVSTIGGTRLRFFADYNNDGDFSDSGESSPQYTLNGGNNNYSIPFTSGSNPVQDQLLRFRIIVSNGTIASNGCTSPSNGEVEDYSLFFGTTQVLGCTDPAASNYDPNATVDDGSCEFGSLTWYRDFDNDTYGDPNVSQQSVTQPAGYVLDDTDCDDMDSNAFPGNPEICDGIDNNCDGNIDEGVFITWYRDFDNDTFGNPNITSQSCTQPSGFVADNTDCDDFDALEFPGQIWFKDFDGDGYGDGVSTSQCNRPNNYYVASELISTTDDCDDEEEDAFPGNPEVCDGIDNNCDGNTDEGVLIMYFRDFDNDDFGDPNVFTQACSQPAGYVLDNTDCDDMESNAFPGNTEICDGIDNNCDGNTDEVGSVTYYRDLDQDGFGDPSVTILACLPVSGFVLDNTDCDDFDENEFPGQKWYRDVDQDGYSTGTILTQCERPADHYTAAELTQLGGDCDDDDNTINPGAPDICGDGIDNNCNGFTDEPCGPCDGVIVNVPNITQDEYRASNRVLSDGTLSSGQTVLFTAPNFISLDEGFEIEAGSVFLADIYPCDNSSAQEDSDLPVSAINNTISNLEIGIKEELGEVNTLDLKILNKFGEEVFEISNLSSNLLKTILKDNMTNLESGYYILSVISDNKKFAKSILIE